MFTYEDKRLFEAKDGAVFQALPLSVVFTIGIPVKLPGNTGENGPIVVEERLPSSDGTDVNAQWNKTGQRRDQSVEGRSAAGEYAPPYRQFSLEEPFQRRSGPR